MPGEFKQEKLSALQKNLLARWINSLDVWEGYLTAENIIEELKNGVLICNILKFHQPNLDFTGVSQKSRARKQCLNNIEKALSILYQKGAAPRYIPSADEVFEGDKFQDKVWILIKTIFDVIAMHDVTLLFSKIVKWMNLSLSYFPGREQLRSKVEDIYQDFKSGVSLACIIALYVDNDKQRPDFRQIYEHPQNRQEYTSNLSYVFKLAISNNVPIYFKTSEFLDSEQYSFLMVQLYYLYFKYKNSQPLFIREDPPHLLFKDEGRILEDNSQTSGQSNATPPQRSSRNQTDSSDVKTNSIMGIITEVDSGDFSSTMKSQSKSTDAKGKINNQKVQEFISQAEQQYQQYSQNYQQQEMADQIEVDYSKDRIKAQRFKVEYEDDDGNVIEDDEAEGNNGSNGGSSSQNEFMMKHNIKQLSNNNSNRQKNSGQGIEQFKQQSYNQQYNQFSTQFAIVDENIGMFNQNLDNLPAFKANSKEVMPQPQIIKAEPYIQERRGFFMEDLRTQLSKNAERKYDVSEDELTKMYYSSTGVNQTANFNNNFNTMDGSQTHHSKSDSLMGGGSTFNYFQQQKQEQFFNTLGATPQDYQQEKLRIFDEKGEIDELKCLQLLFTPQICQASFNGTQYSRAFLLVKTSECFFSELTEGYSIKLLEYPSRKTIIEIQMSTVELIVMKNIIQRHFLIQADNGKVKIIVEISDKSDIYFQALDYIFQKTSIKRN